MFLMSSELSREDFRHRYCSDPELATDIATVSRSLTVHGELAPSWLNVDHESALDEKEVPLCQPR